MFFVHSAHWDFLSTHISNWLSFSDGEFSEVILAARLLISLYRDHRWNYLQTLFVFFVVWSIWSLHFNHVLIWRTDNVWFNYRSIQSLKRLFSDCRQKWPKHRFFSDKQWFQCPPCLCLYDSGLPSISLLIFCACGSVSRPWSVQSQTLKEFAKQNLSNKSYLSTKICIVNEAKGTAVLRINGTPGKYDQNWL